MEQNSLQLNPSVTEKKRLCLLWCCKHSVNLRAYWLLSNYTGTQKTSSKQASHVIPQAPQTAAMLLSHHKRHTVVVSEEACSQPESSADENIRKGTLINEWECETFTLPVWLHVIPDPAP